MSPVWRVVTRRLANAVPVLAIVAVGSYGLLELAPGDAVDAYLSGSGGDAGLVAQLRQQWGLDRSFGTRLLSYLLSLLSLDLGWSVAFTRPVREVVLDRLGNTLLLMSAAIAFSFSVGTLLGIAAGSRPQSWRDRLLSVLALALYAAPSFWLGLMLIVGFAVKLSWFPLGGIASIGDLLQQFGRIFLPLGGERLHLLDRLFQNFDHGLTLPHLASLRDACGLPQLANPV